MEIAWIHNQLMKGIYFVPYIGPAEVEEIKSQLSSGLRPKIGLSARHQTDYVPDNITVFDVVELISRSEKNDSRNQYNLDRIRVTKDGAEAIIIINFPESIFTIDKSNDEFNDLILHSIEWSRR